MIEVVLDKNQEGQRLDRILRKILKEAPEGFLYKMLRKKSITLNKRRAEGSDRVHEGDVIQFFLSRPTFDEMRGTAVTPEQPEEKHPDLEILYEDGDVLVFVKPAGLLSQKAEENDWSANDWVIAHAVEKGLISASEFETFRPSVCNRLDRNTGGIMAAGMSYKGLKVLSELFRERTLDKYYYALVSGEVRDAQEIGGYLEKDEETNRVTIYEYPGKKRREIHTFYEPIAYDREKDLTLLRVHLLTGRSHQIRAHLAFIGHPILGDLKYGNALVNAEFRRKTQCLFSYKTVFPECALEGISGRTFELPVPSDWPVRGGTT